MTHSSQKGILIVSNLFIHLASLLAAATKMKTWNDWVETSIFSLLNVLIAAPVGESVDEAL